jgi:gliding motility-associated lipoprotein GldD
MRIRLPFILLLCTVVFFGCKEEEILPKPKAMLRLEYVKPPGNSAETPNFTFDYNSLAQTKIKNSSAIALKYPDMKASIFMSYRKIKGDLKNLTRDAHKLSYEHAAKADGIRPRPYEDLDNKVYGVFFEVSGNAASQAQFYVTDSLNHFVTGALYFETKPNYDSIYPAAVYLQQDMGRIMETLRWKK